MAKNNSLPQPDDKQLEASHTQGLPAGDDLAAEALANATASAVPASSPVAASSDDNDDEVTRSNEIAETITSLQRLIERHADELDRTKNELKEIRDSLRNIFENDLDLAEAQQQAETFSTQVKERKSMLQNQPDAVRLKNKVAELSEQKKEIEETLSNHLVNYYQLTNSTSFDTSEGDQREFKVRAQVLGKSRK